MLCRLAYALFQTGHYGMSVVCWEALLRRNCSAKAESPLTINLARASYMAAGDAARAGQYDSAARLLGAYYALNPGDPAAKALSGQLRRLIDLQAGIAAVADARRLAGEGRWSEAADRLLSVRDKVGPPGANADNMQRAGA